MVTKNQIEAALRNATMSRDMITDMMLQLNEFMPVLTDDTVENYMKEVKVLKDNQAKVNDNSTLKDISNSVNQEIAYAVALNRLYYDELSSGNINYDKFLVEYKMLNASLRDGLIETGKPKPGGSGSQPRPTQATRKPETPTPQPHEDKTPGDDMEDSLEMQLRQIAEMDARERGEKDKMKDLDRGDRNQQKADRDREIQEQARKDREAMARKDREAKDRKIREDRERRERQEREDRERRDREKRERENKVVENERKDRDRIKRENEKQEQDRKLREQQERKRREEDLKKREKDKKEKDRVDTAKRVISDTGFDDYVATNIRKDDKGTPTRSAAYDDPNNIGKLIGTSHKSIENHDAFARLIANGIPGMLNQDRFVKLVGGTMPSMLQEKQIANFIGENKDSMLNEHNIASLIGQSKNNMINTDGVANLIGKALEGMTTVESEREIAERQNNELREEIKAREEALNILSTKLHQVEGEENQLKDKLHSIRTHSNDVKSDIDKLKQENEEQSDEQACLKEEIKNLKKGISDMDHELEDIENTEKDRMDAHRELKKEKNTHKEALQKLEIEIQTCKNTYEGMMKRWQDDISGATRASIAPVRYQYEDPVSYSVSNSTRNYPVTSQSRFTTNQPSYPTDTMQNNFIGVGSHVEYGGQAWRHDQPPTRPESNLLVSEIGRFTGSKYASKYLSSDFRT